MSRAGDWIQSYTGKQLWPLDCRPEDLHLEDIAHSLALQCRFVGHCKTFYSVAQHSALVSEQFVDLNLQRWGLLHDAEEALLGDISRPLKRSLKTYAGGTIACAQHRIEKSLIERFGLEPLGFLEATLKLKDDVLLATELRDVMNQPEHEWDQLPPPLPTKIIPVEWRDAKAMFLERAERLGLR